jgi:hypothetical protein
MTVINSAKKTDPKSLNASLADFNSAPPVKSVKLSRLQSAAAPMQIKGAGSGETPGDDYQDNQLYTPLKKTNSS